MRLRRAGRRDPPPAGSAPATPEERHIVEALARLRTTTAREVMTPRVDVVALRQPVSPADVARAVKESGHSRFPVYAEDLDDIVGVLYVKDLFRMNVGDITPRLIARRLRRPFLVPEGRHALELLSEMRQGRRAFAVVVDEYGGVEGVLTIKDVVGELVGALPDEFDPVEDAEITRIDASRWLVDGQTPADRVRSELGAPLPAGPFVTIGGFLFDRFGRIPADGDTVVDAGWEYRIAEMERRRIAKVVVRGPGPAADPTTEAEATPSP